ncbi:MAG: HD domain-containing protein [Eubacteriales bacterium]|nr:HD domain-containing protein [Eubacteriales bacterium]
MITFSDIKNDERIKTFIARADASLLALGYTEHSFAHVGMVSSNAAYILEMLGYSEHEVELVRIASYLHDLGNLVNRADHSQSGAIMAFRILEEMDMDAEDLALIVTAIGNHDEGTGVPVNAIAAALIIADKSDVRRSRVRNRNRETFDIHDRVNYSVTESGIAIDDAKTVLTLRLTIDTQYCSIMDFFEIFLARMKLCCKAAERLGLRFELVINGQKLL